MQQALAAGQGRRYDQATADNGTAVPFDTEWMRTTSTIVGKLKAEKQHGLLAYDSFDPAGPFAWRGAWALHDPDTTEGIFQTVGGLRHGTMPAMSMSSGAGFLKNRVAVSRLAPFTLPTDVDGAYYFSFLTRADRRPTEGEPCFVQLSFRQLNDQEPRRRLAATVSWSRSSISIGWDGPGQHASVPLDFSRTYLVVGKIMASAAGPDQAFVRLYGTKDRLPVDEPLSWTVSSRPVVSRREFDLVQWSSMSEFGIAVDELRLGTNWNSVAEPYQQESELVAPASLRIPSSRSKGRPTVQVDLSTELVRRRRRRVVTVSKEPRRFACIVLFLTTTFLQASTMELQTSTARVLSRCLTVYAKTFCNSAKFCPTRRGCASSIIFRASPS